MYNFSKIAIQPFPYSNSLLYLLLKNNIHFIRWYNNFDFMNNNYQHTNMINNHEYNIQFQYNCIHNQNNNTAYHDIIKGTLLLKYHENVYTETIKQKIKYNDPITIPYFNYYRDYDIKTEHLIKKNNKIVNNVNLCNLIETISNNKL